MTGWRWVAWISVIGALSVGAGAAVNSPAVGAQAARGTVAQLSLDGPIGPAAAEYFSDASKRAVGDGALAIVLRLDTPGGLAESMRQIIADMLACPVPVLAYVAPSGARAASAGTYILYAAQIAAMAPATHLGAATPVSIGGRTPMPPPVPRQAALASRRRTRAARRRQARAATPNRTRSSTMRSPTFAPWRSCAGAMRPGPSRPCAAPPL